MESGAMDRVAVGFGRAGPRAPSRRLAWLPACVALLLAFTASPAAATPPPYLALFPDFAPELSPFLPGDIDTTLEASLEEDGEFARVQRLFDLYAWQMFVAADWPAGTNGAPAYGFTAPGPPRWARWATSDMLFRTGRAVPLPCRRARLSAPPLRRLRLVSTLAALDVTSFATIHDPTDAPLIDQHGNFVFYETLLDPNETQYICRNALYAAAGQAAFMAHHRAVDFPAGEEDIPWSGSFSIKLAWKVLDPANGDEPSRFFTAPATILDLDAAGHPIERRVLVGLVGMHIVHKSISAPQRIWATFEQVDNLAVDPVADPGLRPSFFNPDCPLCLPNIPPRRKSGGGYERTPVQVMRTVPIPRDTAHLDREARAALARLGSVWQYYRLVGTQWPTVPTASPAGLGAGRTEAILDSSGGGPTLPFLANVTMETYVQAST